MDRGQDREGREEEREVSLQERCEVVAAVKATATTRNKISSRFLRPRCGGGGSEMQESCVEKCLQEKSEEGKKGS